MLATSDSGALLRFVQGSHHVDLKEGETALKATGRYAELVALYRSRDQHAAALNTLKAVSQQQDLTVAPQGTSKTKNKKYCSAMSTWKRVLKISALLWVNFLLECRPWNLSWIGSGRASCWSIYLMEAESKLQIVVQTPKSSFKSLTSQMLANRLWGKLLSTSFYQSNDSLLFSRAYWDLLHNRCLQPSYCHELCK